MHLWTQTENWKIDLEKFRIYLKDKFNVDKAYYFLGYIKDENNWLYQKIQESWYVIIFKQQQIGFNSHKKWNIDSDLIFNIMKKLIKQPTSFDKIVLVTWDGDFKILVDFLIEEKRFKKILFPSKKYTSSLYNHVKLEYKDFLINLKNKIQF